jgi:predicted component of type VI protein secretion system
MDKLPVEILQYVANWLSADEYQYFRTLNTRSQRLGATV